MEPIIIRLGAVDFSHDCQKFLDQHLKVKTYRKDEFLLQPGQIATDIAFIYSGFLHTYVPSYKGMVVTEFTVENNVFISPFSFFRQTLAVEYVQALDETKVYLLSYADTMFACKQFEEFNTVIYNALFISRSRQHLLGMLHLEKPSKRYEWLNDHYSLAPDVYRRHIAMQIGLTVEQLADFDRRKRKRKSSTL